MSKKKKNSFKSLKKFDKFLLTILTLISFGFLIYLAVNNVLPFKYLIIIIIAISLIVFLLNKIYISSCNKGKGIIIKALYIIYNLILIIGVIYFQKSFSVYDSFQGKYKKITYYVVALKDKNYKSIKDIDGMELGVYDGATNTKNKAINKLSKKINFTEKDYKDSLEMTEDVINEKTSAMLIEEGYFDSAMEANEDKNYKEKLSIIYKFSFMIKVNDITKEAKVTTEPFAVYISGIDTYGEISSVSRSDVNILAVINPKTKEVLLVSTPRDYYVMLGNTDSYDKLTHAGLFGIETSVKTIENLYDVNVNYYFKVNFTSVVDIIDVLDGIDVNSEYAFTSYSGYPIKRGKNHMDGKTALDFARTRKIFTAGDRVRGMNQLAVINGVIDKALSKSIIIKYSSLLSSVKNKFQTNLSTNNIKKLIKMQLSDNAAWNINTISVGGSDANKRTYSYPNQELYAMIPDENQVNKVKDYIKKLYNGEKLGDVSEIVESGVIRSYSSSVTKKEEVKEIKEEEDEVKEIKGCMDKKANNYNKKATIDDNSCKYDIIINGCMDKEATNYNPDANNPKNDTCIYKEEDSKEEDLNNNTEGNDTNNNENTTNN